MQTAYPTFTDYVTDPMAIADNIFATSLLAKSSQTAVFYGSISSLDEIMMRYTNNVSGLTASVSEMYKNLFERYFDSADVSVDSRKDKSVGNGIIMDIRIVYVNDRIRRDFAESVIYLNGKSKRLSEVING